MRTLRIICQEVDRGAAFHVGGPVYVEHKTFDVQIPEDVCKWLEEIRQLRERSVVGVEVLSAVDSLGEATPICARSEAWEKAFDTIRDAVLHGRHQLAEMDVDCDIISAVLGIIDDHDPRPISDQPSGKTG